jgi:fatty-acyl-CoA synthase
MWGERPLALIVPRTGFAGSIDARAIRSFLERFVESGRISRLAVPDRIEFVEALVRTSVGKVDKKVMRERYCIAVE